MPTADVRLTLLGGFRLVQSGVTVAVPPTAAKLLSLLALQDGPLPRSRIAAAFWPDQAEPRAFANLRATVSRLPDESRSILQSTGGALAIADFVQVDVHAARTVVHDLLDGAAAPGSSRTNVDLLSRPLLPEWDDDWLTFERERTRQLHIHALEHCGHALLGCGDALSAVDVAISVVGAEPLRESAHVLLINAYLACGNRADARRSYDRYRALMRRELDLEPAVDWADLVTAAARRPGHGHGSPRRAPRRETSR